MDRGDNFFLNNSYDNMVLFKQSSVEEEEYIRRISSWLLEAKEQEHSEEKVDQVVMLDHLDSMLIVPLHLEINDDDHDDNNNDDGQFNDTNNDDMNLL